jgi:hypothetical protein
LSFQEDRFAKATLTRVRDVTDRSFFISQEMTLAVAQEGQFLPAAAQSGWLQPDK